MGWSPLSSWKVVHTAKIVAWAIEMEVPLAMKMEETLAARGILRISTEGTLPQKRTLVIMMEGTMPTRRTLAINMEGTLAMKAGKMPTKKTGTINMEGTLAIMEGTLPTRRTLAQMKTTTKGRYQMLLFQVLATDQPSPTSHGPKKFHTDIRT